MPSEIVSPPINWPYVVFAVFLTTALLAVCAYTGPWLMTASAFAGEAWLLRYTYRIVFTRFTAIGVRQPTLRGQRFIPWTGISDVRLVRYGIHIHGSDSRIVLAPFAYRNPDAVIALVHEHAPQAI